jgi:hypothetical protein
MDFFNSIVFNFYFEILEIHQYLSVMRLFQDIKILAQNSSLSNFLTFWYS